MSQSGSLIVETLVVTIEEWSKGDAMKCSVFLILSGCLLMVETKESTRGDLYPKVREYLMQRAGEFAQIPAERKQVLDELSAYVRQCVSEGRPAKLTFVCTHNSRRSHFAQIWAQIASSYYGIDNVHAYSGGTEATAFNPRTVAALERCGIRIGASDASVPNPHYEVTFEKNGSPLIGFSKVYNTPPNPVQGYCAIMTCSQADESCPSAPGCELRIAIPYDDPKISDDTALEAATYDERCRQIAREMLYMMSRVRR